MKPGRAGNDQDGGGGGGGVQGAYFQGQEMLNSFGNTLNMIKSKPTAMLCTFSTSSAKQVTVKSRVGQNSNSAWEFKRHQLQAGWGGGVVSGVREGIAPGTVRTCPRF